MRINKFGQVTNKSSDLLLTPQQEEFMKSLLDNGKATSLSLRYGRAWKKHLIVYIKAWILRAPSMVVGKLKWELAMTPL